MPASVSLDEDKDEDEEGGTMGGGRVAGVGELLSSIMAERT